MLAHKLQHHADHGATRELFELRRATMPECVQREMSAYLAEGRAPRGALLQ